MFKVNKNFNFHDEEILLEIDNNIRISEVPNEKMISMVMLNLMFFKDKSFEESPFKLELEIEGLFGWEKELEEDLAQLEILLKENAPAILYSYLRPLITSISIEANLPPLVIPLMNFRE